MHLIFFITLPLDMGAKMQNYKIKIANIPWDLLKGCTKCRNICKQTASHCFPPSFIVLVQLVFEPSVKEKKKFNHMGLKHCPSVISTKFTKCNGDYSKKKSKLTCKTSSGWESSWRKGLLTQLSTRQPHAAILLRSCSLKVGQGTHAALQKMKTHNALGLP